MLVLILYFPLAMPWPQDFNPSSSLFNLIEEKANLQRFSTKLTTFKDFIHKDWAKYYGSNQNPTIFTNETRNEIFNSSLSQIYVKNCEFLFNEQPIYSSDRGKYSRMLIENSLFTNCFAQNSYGGAIYFYKSGECVLSGCCSLKCSSYNNNGYNYGQFAYIDESNDYDYQPYKNYVIYSSVCLSLYDEGWSTLYNNFGVVRMEYNNISHNIINKYSACHISYPPISSYEYDSYSAYNSYNHNNSTDYVCLYIYSGTHNITCCNIIWNSQNSSNSGVIYVRNFAEAYLSHCVILYNEGPYALFAWGFSSITCTDCLIGSDQKNNEDEIIIITNTPSSSFINKINLLDCQSIFSPTCYRTYAMKKPRFRGLLFDLLF